MIIALILIAIALQIVQWRLSKKCIDRYKLIAQEWRESAETVKDESTTNKALLVCEISVFRKELSAIKKAQKNASNSKRLHKKIRFAKR